MFTKISEIIAGESHTSTYDILISFRFPDIRIFPVVGMQHFKWHFRPKRMKHLIGLGNISVLKLENVLETMKLPLSLVPRALGCARLKVLVGRVLISERKKKIYSYFREA